MPATLRVGSRVSSLSSKYARVLDLEPGSRRRKKERVYGVVLRSTTEGKWEVRWDSGQLEAMCTGTLKKEGEPTEDSTALVRQTMGVRR